MLGQRQAVQWSLFLGGAAAIGSAILWAVAPTIVQLLFQRGAFTAANWPKWRACCAGVVHLPFYFAGIALCNGTRRAAASARSCISPQARWP